MKTQLLSTLMAVIFLIVPKVNFGLANDLDEQSVKQYERVSCYGGSDGWALGNATGGKPPYSYLWSDGQITAEAVNLKAGIYSVIVTDDNGCTSIRQVEITQPPLLTGEISDYQMSNGEKSVGTATITALGGTPPYSYLWSNGQTTAKADYLTSGSYTVIVTDANGCTTESSVFVAEEEDIELDQLTLNMNDPAQTVVSDKVTEVNVFPNPFRHSTTVRFNVEQDTRVLVEVYSMLGARIATLFEGQAFSTDTYSVVFNVENRTDTQTYLVVIHTDYGKTTRTIFTY